jgi:hypothetical protein
VHPPAPAPTEDYGDDDGSHRSPSLKLFYGGASSTYASPSGLGVAMGLPVPSPAAMPGDYGYDYHNEDGADYEDDDNWAANDDDDGWYGGEEVEEEEAAEQEKALMARMLMPPPSSKAGACACVRVCMQRDK